MRALLAVVAAVALFAPAAAPARERAQDARVSPSRVAAKACKARAASARNGCVARKLRGMCRTRRYRAHRDCRTVRRVTVPPVPVPVADPGAPAPLAGPAPEPALAVAAPARVAQEAAAPEAPAAPAVLPPSLSRMQVTAREFSLTPSRTSLPAGVTRVELINFGEDPHDMRARPAAGGSDTFTFPSVDAGAKHTQDVTLTSGRWTFYCALPEHESLGMSTIVTVP